MYVCVCPGIQVDDGRIQIVSFVCSFRLGFGKERKDDEVLRIIKRMQIALDWTAAFFCFGLVCVARCCCFSTFANTTTYALLCFWDWITSMYVVIEMRASPFDIAGMALSI